MDKIQFGERGESAAAEYLKQKGYRILAQNYRTKLGEIDIIAKYGDSIVFVEVKTRSNYNYGTPAEAVTYQKQKKIIRTALCYLSKSNSKDFPDVRFDILEVLLSRNNGSIRYNHIENAFGQ